MFLVDTKFVDQKTGIPRVRPRGSGVCWSSWEFHGVPRCSIADSELSAWGGVWPPRVSRTLFCSNSDVLVRHDACSMACWNYNELHRTCADATLAAIICRLWVDIRRRLLSFSLSNRIPSQPTTAPRGRDDEVTSADACDSH